MGEEELKLSTNPVIETKGKDLFKNYGYLLLILIPIMLSIYLRMSSASLPMINDWAASSVDDYYINSFKYEMHQQFPNLPDDILTNNAVQQYEQYKKDNPKEIQDAITQTTAQFKSYYQDENGYGYMPDIDPYTYLRYARNYQETGHVGDEIKNGVEWDNHMIAPLGKDASQSPHPKVLVYVYNVMHAFNSKMTLMQSANYFSVIIAALAVIPFFFIGRRIAGNIGGLFSAIIVATNSSFLSRTLFGHADTDVYVLFFAGYFLMFFIYALNTENWMRKIMHLTLSGACLGFFSLFWLSGWWYIFDFAVGATAIYLIWNLIKKEDIKPVAISLIGLIFFTGLFVTSFQGMTAFTDSITQPFNFVNIKQASNTFYESWPNVYTTVAEMNQASMNTILNTVNVNFFLLSVLGIILLMIFDKNKFYAGISILWMIGGIYASMKGIRFAMILVPPMAIGIGYLFGKAYEKVLNYAEKTGINRLLASATMICLLSVMFVPYCNAMTQEAKQDLPMINDAWFFALDKIRTESEPDAIVNSWWDFGHHFKYFTDRAVTFDGSTQNTPMAYWIGRVLLTNNQDEAVGILRMLDCGSNQAFEELNKQLNDTSESVKILHQLVLMDRSQAESYLVKNNIKASLITKTHCDPPENYLITSEDMVGKAAVWGHFGSWNFDKADLWGLSKTMNKDDLMKEIQTRLNQTPAQAKQTYYEIKTIADENAANNWIAGWPGYSNMQTCNQLPNYLSCNGIDVNLTTRDVIVMTDKGIQNPESYTYLENNLTYLKTYKDSTLGQSVIQVNDNLLVASPEIVDSMFTRLFFYEGRGLNHFERFAEATQPTGERIIVYKVKW